MNQAAGNSLRTRNWFVLALMAGPGFLTGPLYAQQRAVQSSFASPRDLAAGAAMYRSNCARCHGRSGRGALGPDLSTGRFRYAVDDNAMFSVINDGIPGTDMPPFYWLRSEVAIRQLVGFVRSLGEPRGGVKPSGDSTAGESVFRGKGACVRCHMVGGVGGRQGPDLSDIGWRRPVSYLRAALLNPDENVAPRWWTVKVTGSDGKVVTGLRMDEDTYGVRILDGADNLRAVDKAGKVERIEGSPMPSYRDALTEAELDDLVAYLYRLRGATR